MASTQPQIHWSTTGDGKPPDIPQKVWNNMPDELKAKIRAQGQAEAQSDANDANAVDEINRPINDHLYGNQSQNDAYVADQLMQQQIAAQFGVPADTVFTRNGVPLWEPTEQPGAIAQADRRDADIYSQQQQFIDQVIKQNNAVTSGLSDRFAQFDAQDQATLDQLRTDFGNINLAPFEAIPDSVAAQAYADPAAIAAQNQALDMLFGAASGSMDAHSNPQDVARQQQMFNMLLGAANGSLDAHTNPEDLARQTKTADKLWGLTDPEITAEEKFIMEKARMLEEQDRRAAMDASLRNLAARGQLGSGHEIGAMLGAQQTTSQNRLLSDLGAQANAVARSMNALGMHSQLATAMRNASDALTAGNMTRRLGGMEGASNTATNMRNASDNMAQGNMNRRLNATTSAGNLASNMRDSSFNEAYSRGKAVDTINMANQASKQNWNIANANLETNQAQGLAQVGLGVTSNASNRATGLANTQIANNNSGFNAQTSLTDLGTTQNNNSFNRGFLGAQSKSKALGDAFYLDEYQRGVNAIRYGV